MEGGGGGLRRGDAAPYIYIYIYIYIYMYPTRPPTPKTVRIKAHPFNLWAQDLACLLKCEVETQVGSRGMEHGSDQKQRVVVHSKHTPQNKICTTKSFSKLMLVLLLGSILLVRLSVDSLSICWRLKISREDIH